MRSTIPLVGLGRKRILDSSIDMSRSINPTPAEDLEDIEELKSGAAKGLLNMQHNLYVNLRSKLKNKKDTGWTYSRPALELVASFEDQAQVKSLLKALTGLLLYAYGAEDLPSTLPKKIDAWWEGSKDAVKSYKIKQKQIDDAVAKIGSTKKLSATGRNMLRDKLRQFRTLMAPVLKDKLRNDPVFTTETISMLNDILIAYNNESLPAMQRIARKITFLKDPLLSNLYSQFYEANVEEKSSSDNTAEKTLIAFLSKNLGIKDRPWVKLSEIEKLKKNEELYKNYLALRQAQNNAYRLTLAKLIRASGKDTIDVKEARKYLKSQGISDWRIPTGFIGRIDETGALYTTVGNKLGGGLLGGKVVMNPNYDPEKDDSFVFTGQGLYAAGSQHYYTENYVQKKRAPKKSANVNILIDNVETKRPMWTKDILKTTKNSNIFDKAVAVAIEILYQEQPRAGSKVGLTDGKPTYALTTVLGKHVKVGPSSITFKYPGKKGVEQKFVLKKGDAVANAVYDFVAFLKSECGPNEKLWELGPDMGPSAIYAGINKRLKEIFGGDVSSHKMRHAKGTSLLKQLVEEKPPTKAQEKTTADFDKYLSDKLTKVGDKLGHKRTKPDGTTEPVGTTARSAYVLPEYMDKLFSDRNLRRPAWLERLFKNTTSEV